MKSTISLSWTAPPHLIPDIVTQSNIYVLYVHMYVHTYIHTKRIIHTVHTCGEEAPRLRNGCHIATGEPIQTMSFHVVVHRGMYCNTDHAIKEGRNICITLMYVCTYVYIFVQVNVRSYIIYMCVCMRAWYARTYLCMYYVENRRKNYCRYGNTSSEHICMYVHMNILICALILIEFVLFLVW